MATQNISDIPWIQQHYKMPSKDGAVTSNVLLASTLLVTALGAYQLGKRKESTAKGNKPTLPLSIMVASSRIVKSLLSLSFLSSSTSGFTPPSYSYRGATRNEIVNHSVKLGCSEPSSAEEINEKKVQAEGVKVENENTTNNVTDEIKTDASLLESITMQPIGHVSSVYRLCVGTPRQGLLAPNSRGRIDLYPDRIASDSILDLENFSHLWVVFIFHLNSNAKSVEKSKQHTLENGKVVKNQFPSKIKPPALGGKRVGIFATRSPHRPNPVGFSLCKIDKIVIPPRKKHQKETPYHIYVSGLDLVDGTPVLDIKPYVPHYDSVGYMYEEGMGVEKEARLPQWVSDGLGKRRDVDFTPEAYEQLKNIVMSDDGKELEFYGTSTGRDDTDEEALESIKNCISEVLSVDVRSKWQTARARKGKSRAETTKRVKEIKSGESTSTATATQTTEPAVDTSSSSSSSSSSMDNVCTQQLDRLLIKFTVREEVPAQNEKECSVDTQGSGADDGIVVVGIEFMQNKTDRFT